ncbi:MAG: outer membrane lipid asymmetry maintenance protein MlaD [Rhodovulum sp.]|jgi:phospholipid/cholesterol/gamma-HCH transport system substrate-binding protein|uniref:outer membrane lipid asymmetry maintenance protein MlaD n=1 Tax=Rhodovulum sp. FJ3 TaxID=3079053 RepID=UPI000C0B1C89|nr:outer membrane lipid asymmetry maintenance protein MlaD [Rhodovulum sp. FJ3]MAY31502.1 outer membrane lipid asymmetry maintenance protein MlaD [Rhodovulum sp.]MDV4167629.1 outer membrane lipid asymmetry maintenance protein MlaD [Rhodovulum sp. FJ3]|tara:strand:- start:766 stop:1221 length:456 start_codon:yes stop_codon:yes gene_type:complete
MAENATEVAVGGAVLAAAAGFLFYVVNATGVGSTPSGVYELGASFRSVQGIAVGTDVRMAGVKIGTVTGLDLNPTTFRADTTFTVQDDILLPDDSGIIVASEGLLGGNFIEIVPGGSPINLEPGEEIIDTQGAVGLIELLTKFVGAAAGDS